MELGHMGNHPPVAEPSFLARAFRPGIRVVYRSRGQRTLEGVILRVENGYAYVRDESLGQVSEEKVSLKILKDLNATIFMTARQAERANQSKAK